MTSDRAEQDVLRPDDLHWLQGALQGVVTIEDVTVGVQGTGAIRVRGRFLMDTAEAYACLAPRLRALGRTVRFRREGPDAVILITEGINQPRPNNTWLPIVLALGTVFSVLLSYALFWQGAALTLSSLAGNLLAGWPFAASLLGILLAHELGHFFTARHLGVAVTLPFLIPFPLSPFGTMGAVIRMKDIPPSKRAMLLIGSAGPLAGLAVAIPVLLYGLSLSSVGSLPAEGGYVLEGNSLLYAALKYLSFGRWLPGGGLDVNLHPVAFAGWAGLLVTALNLIPAGQLDGGHIAYALLGDRARHLTWVVIGAVLLLGFVWRGWLIWAVLIYLFSRTTVRPMDDVSSLKPGEVALGLILLVVFALAFTPLPLQVISPSA